MSNTVVTEEMISAVAWSPSHQEGVPWGMLLNDEQIGNILNIGLANAPAALQVVVTEEMVENACRAAYPGWDEIIKEAERVWKRKQMQSTLSAALQSAADTLDSPHTDPTAKALRAAIDRFDALPPSKVREE